MGLEAFCCDSCHEDYAMGYDAVGFTTSDGVDVDVCCRVSDELERRFGGDLNRIHSAMLPAAKWTRPW